MPTKGEMHGSELQRRNFLDAHIAIGGQHRQVQEESTQSEQDAAEQTAQNGFLLARRFGTHFGNERNARQDVVRHIHYRADDPPAARISHAANDRITRCSDRGIGIRQILPIREQGDERDDDQKYDGHRPDGSENLDDTVHAQKGAGQGDRGHNHAACELRQSEILIERRAGAGNHDDADQEAEQDGEPFEECTDVFTAEEPE